jgi:murein DD-endopeptidase MepM/ murein hydrolase activator NlpD
MTRGFTVILVLVLVVLAVLAVQFAVSTHSTLAFDPQPASIGTATRITVRIANLHGIRHAVAWMEQDSAIFPLTEKNQPAKRFVFGRAPAPPQNVTFNAGKEKAPTLKEGKARIVFEAQSNDFRAATDRISTDVTVILRPPSVVSDGFQHYINQGGSELAILTPGGSWTEAGVRVGDRHFRSFPFPGDPARRFALFAYSWNTPTATAPVVYAKNAVGTEASAPLWFKAFPKKFRMRNLEIDDQFLEKVVNDIDPGGSGDLLTRFLKINGEMRRENDKTLSDLRFKTAEKFLWNQSFVQLANSKVESAFADVRSYMYKGKRVDQQTHLGFDLSTTLHHPVVAANSGRVVWAQRLGIYGNCIVVDHGYGLQSIYGHLSEFEVKEGDMVARGQEIGRSGSTGLAGGDHLHFSMQVDGMQVNPIEWWDEHWIKDHMRIRLPLPTAQ